MKRYELFNGTRVKFETPKGQSFKFGYYNYSPVNSDNTKLLAHKIPFERRMPEKRDIVEVGYFNMHNHTWKSIAKTSAYNWQQGAMLQWLNNGKGNKVIFNDAKNQQYISRILDVVTEEEKELPIAIYGITPDCKYAITLNFERCHYTRAYSYASIVDETWKEKNPEKDGIIRVNLKTGAYERIISLTQMIERIDADANRNHWFEHIMVNPKSDRFAFYLRSELDKGFETRCFTANTDGSEIWEHPYRSNERLTHFGWRDETSYVVYTIVKTGLQTKWVKGALKGAKPNWYIQLYRKYLKPLIPRNAIKRLPSGKSFYALAEDRNGIVKRLDPFPGQMDGHPSFTKNGRYMLTDTYADERGYRHLLLFDMKMEVSFQLGAFYSAFNNCGWRADLHPRFSPDGQHVVIDSSHDGYHRMLVLELNWEGIESHYLNE